jgi:hypothetical protein
MVSKYEQFVGVVIIFGAPLASQALSRNGSIESNAQYDMKSTQ